MAGNGKGDDKANHEDTKGTKNGQGWVSGKGPLWSRLLTYGAALTALPGPSLVLLVSSWFAFAIASRYPNSEFRADGRRNPHGAPGVKPMVHRVA